jgi:hypothetical protein
MEQKKYIPNSISPPPPPKSPGQKTDAELDGPGLDPQHQQERQHRELRSRVDSLLSIQSALKESVDRLHRARCVDKAILIATIAGVAVGLIGIFVAILL